MKNEDTKKAQLIIDEDYRTLNLSSQQLKDVLKDIIYNLPKKYCTKKEIYEGLSCECPKFNRKNIKGYMESLDESRLEEFVGKVFDAVDECF